MSVSSSTIDTAHERILLFSKAPRMIYLGHISSACVLIYLASRAPHVPEWFLYLWAAIELVATPLALGWLAHSYQKDAEGWRTNKQLWMTSLESLFLFIGISWGVLLSVSLNPENAAHFSMQMAIAAGASAAAVKSLGLLPRAFKFYSIPFLGLLSARLFFLGGDYIMLGALVLVFLIMLLGLSKDVLLAIDEFIAIKHQNLGLAEQYKEAAAQADNANREKTRLLTAASHDMRQPICAAALHLEALSVNDLNEQDQTIVVHIKEALDLLDKMFNSVLDVSLLDAGEISVCPTNVPLRTIIQNIVDDFQKMAEAAGTSIHTEISDVTVLCDPILLRRMLQNLISNAIRYGAASKITVYTIEDKGTLSIHVQDMGPGIPQKNQTIIFEEFSRPHQNQAEEHSRIPSDHNTGLGLGLAIVKRLAALQDISVSVSSGPSGTIFTLGLIPVSPPL